MRTAMPTVWNARVVCPSFAGLRNGVDRTGVEGIAEIRYTIPNILVEYHPPEVGIPDQLLAVGRLFAQHVLHGKLHG